MIATRLRRILTMIFGHWQAPPWLQCCARHPFRTLGTMLGILGLFIGGVLGWAYYQNLPQPQTMRVTFQPPGLTNYHHTPAIVSPFIVKFDGSAAPLDDIGHLVTDGISLSPHIAGQWRWASDRRLEFMPDGDWPIAMAYRVNIDQEKLLASHILLNHDQLEFNTEPFRAHISESRLYQDPQHPDIKQLVATIRFSHPVDVASVSSHLSLTLGAGLTYRPAQANQMDLTFDDKHLSAYVHSPALATPLEGSHITLEMDKGIRAATGGNESGHDQSSIQVPGRYQLSFENIRTSFVYNDKDEPERVITMRSSRPVGDEALVDKVHAWLLPLKNKDGYAGWSASSVTDAILETSPAVALKPITGAGGGLNSQHVYKFDAPSDRYVAIKVDAHIEGQGGYLSRDAYFRVIHVPDYPKKLQFLGEGSLITLDDDQRIGYMARGIKDVQVEVAQLLPDQLNALIDQRYGTFSKPRLNNRDFDRMVTREVFTQHLTTSDSSHTLYNSVNLKPFFKDRRGVFVVKVSPASIKDNRTFGYYGHSDRDVRFVVVTDLGILAKRNRDGSQDLFVQSLSKGDPVASAKVAVVGRNGLPVAVAETDDNGHAHFAKLGDLHREKTPLYYRVEKEGDLSFLPITDRRRELDLSRFNTGGSQENLDPNALKAYLFTDRGLYRPGEKVHVANLVKSQNWAAVLDGVPVNMSVSDPRGVTIFNRTFNLDRSGFSALDFFINETAPAGNYQAMLSLINSHHRYTRLGDVTFKVRDFEPDRMKVHLTLNPDQSSLGWLKPEQVVAQVTAEQLFGGPASERRVSGHMILTPTHIRFSQWPGYQFGRHGTLADSYRETLSDSITDDKGHAQLALNLDRFADSTYKLHILSQVFEAGSGHNVSAQNEMLVSGSDWLFGYKADGELGFIRKGSERNIHFQAIGQDLKGTEAPVKIQRIAQLWVSVLVKQNDGTYRYESRRKDKLLETTLLTLDKQGQSLALKTEQPGDYQLRILDENDHLLNQIDYKVAGSGNASRGLERNAELQLNLDQTQYHAGESINISIQAPYSGAGLITIERDKVYAYQWFKMDSTQSVQHITLPKGIEGYAYINVQFLRTPDSDEIFMSPLSYAVKPFKIALGKRQQDIALSLPDKVKPGTKLDIGLNLPETANVLVFGVDAGILQVARYQAPDPLAYFFDKKALTVGSSQILDLLLPDLKLLMQQAAPGGGDAARALLAANLNPFKRKRAKPVVYWSGVQQLTAGRHHLSYEVPDSFNGNIRFFAISVTDHSVGTTKSSVEVKAPVVMMPNVPAMMAPGDQADVALSLYNTEATVADVTLTMTMSDGLTAEASEQTFRIEPGHEATAHFKVKATDVLGEATLDWHLMTSQGELRMRERISVRPITAHRLTLATGVLDQSEMTLKADRPLYAPFSKKEVGLANSPLIWAQGLSQYLADYPYSCTEQIVSRSVPALIMGQPQDNRTAFNQLMNQLRSRQNSRGGFGLWAANPIVRPMVTLYVVDMLLDAKETGYPVPQPLLDRANRYVSNLASGPSNGLKELRQRAYGAYLLARQGVQVSGALADIRERLQRYYPKTWQSDIASAWLAASLTLMQQQELAKPLWDAQKWQLIEDAPARLDLYLDPMVHDTQLLTLIARHEPARIKDVPDELVPQMGAWLTEQRYSSLSAATMIRALKAYGESLGDMNLAMSALVNQSWQALSLPQTELPENSQEVRFSKNGQADAYYLLSQQGFDKSPVAPFGDGLEVSREYLDLENQHLKRVHVGDEFLVRVRLRASQADQIRQVVLIDLLPGGVEPVYRNRNDNFPGWQPPVGISKWSDWSPESVNVREDRVVFYGTATHDVQTFVYQVRATNAGKFQVPPVYAQGLYDPLKQAQGPVSTLTIEKP